MVMQTCWFIDGYNLIHAFPQSDNHVADREKIFSRLADYASAYSSKIVMVLDGKGPQEELSKYRTGFFEVVYSQEVSADTYIEKNLTAVRGQFTVGVVTSDREIKNMACGCGSRVKDSREFCRELESFRKELDNDLFKRKFESHGFHRPFEEKL